jgi:probable phosphoglycerate mutase
MDAPGGADFHQNRQNSFFWPENRLLKKGRTFSARLAITGVSPAFQALALSNPPGFHGQLLYTHPMAAQKHSGPWITAYCDGGSRGNPGPAGYGVYIEDEQGQKVEELYEFLGVKTNNVAEYSGLLAALEFALEEGHPCLRVVADSELMVKQMQGKYRVNSPDLRPLFDEAKRRVARLDGFRIEHVLRNKNKHADRLANLAMDEGTRKTVSRPRAAASPSASASSPAGAGTGSLFAAPPATRPAPPATPDRPIVGFVKGGVVHLVEGELPEGTFVRIIRERK